MTTTAILLTVFGVATWLLYSTYRLWVYYVAVMHLKKIRDTTGLGPEVKTLGTLALIEGYLLDAFINIFVLSFILLEIPREWTVSERLERHFLRPDGWRMGIVLWFDKILNPFDEGHIRGT